jgi:hypothetical protein
MEVKVLGIGATPPNPDSAEPGMITLLMWVVVLFLYSLG